MPIDNNSSNKTINILKASLPFVPPPLQRGISYYVKIEEFNTMINSFKDNPTDNTMEACSFSNSEKKQPFNKIEFINAIRPFLSKGEQELIDMILNVINALQVYNIYKTIPSNSSNPMEGFSSLFGNNFNKSSETEPAYEFTFDFDKFTSSDSSESDESSKESKKEKNKNNDEKSTSNTNPENKTVMSQGPSNMENLKSFLTPSQKALFDTYSTMINSSKNNVV